MSLILAVDCSETACSLALGSADSSREECTPGPGRHGQQILPMYRRLLKDSQYEAGQIDAIAIAAGPGSFTGLRIGFSFAQGLGYALGRPLIPISSLQAMALSWISGRDTDDINRIEVVLNARMGELYLAEFAIGDQCRLDRVCEDRLITLEDFNFRRTRETTAVIGSALSLPEFAGIQADLTDASACICARALLQPAEQMLAEGRVESPLSGEPAYLRRADAWRTLDQQRQHLAQQSTSAQAGSVQGQKN